MSHVVDGPAARRHRLLPDLHARSPPLMQPGLPDDQPRYPHPDRGRRWAGSITPVGKWRTLGDEGRGDRLQPARRGRAGRHPHCSKDRQVIPWLPTCRASCASCAARNWCTNPGRKWQETLASLDVAQERRGRGRIPDRREAISIKAAQRVRRHGPGARSS
ncbi:MAG: hypothetical protein M0C28_43825 [Candidatus Moduliflexus flocculans]|nr:hypothetical protein [Candidatus Moduliflexus flocculans]